MEKQMVKDVIIQQLANFNVESIYGYAGDTTLRFFSALEDSPLTLYTAKHEGAAGLMASAEAKLNDQISVCIAHSGPGTANMINGIADAYSDRVPLLLISGQVPTYNIGTNYKQYVDQRQLTNPLTVYSALLTNPESIVDLLYKAMVTSISQGGVSHLVIPMDMWDAWTKAVPREYPSHLDQYLSPSDSMINRAANIINQAKKPVIFYGRGALDCKSELIKLAEKIKAPLINSLAATGLIGFENDFRLGGLGLGGSKKAEEYMQSSDLIIIIGTTWWPARYTPNHPKTIQFDAARQNIGASQPVELGIVGNINNLLNRLIPHLANNTNNTLKQNIKKLKSSWLKELEGTIHHNQNSPLCPGQVIKTLSEHISPDEIITLDSGDNVIWFSKYFSGECQKILLSGTWRTMGFAIPGALAAKINKTNQPVTAICGDGGIGMVLAELLTITRYKLPVRIILINNGTLSMEENRMKKARITPLEVDLTNPDFTALAKSCGIDAFRVDSIDSLKDILNKTTDIEKPILIDIPCQSPILPGTSLE